jgi:hypothetical protein
LAEEHYPVIAAQAKAEGGEIRWCNETALTNKDVRSCLPSTSIDL